MEIKEGTLPMKKGCSKEAEVRNKETTSNHKF